MEPNSQKYGVLGSVNVLCEPIPQVHRMTNLLLILYFKHVPNSTDPFLWTSSVLYDNFHNF